MRLASMSDVIGSSNAYRKFRRLLGQPPSVSSVAESYTMSPMLRSPVKASSMPMPTVGGQGAGSKPMFSTSWC